MTYSGQLVQPSSISDFFPPVLNKLTIYVPTTPTTAEQSSALTVALAAARSYKLVPVDISVAGWDGHTMPVPPTDALDRSIVIQESGTTGLRLAGSTEGNQVLVLSGTAATLPAQSSLLASVILPLVQTSSASVVKTLTSNPSVPTSATFSQLGITGTSTFSGMQQINLPIDATEFGGVASSLAVTLNANYTPLASGEKGSVQASVGGVVLGDQALGEGGNVTLGLTIPAQLISRTTELLLAVTYYPSNYVCGSIGRTMTFTVDPRSTVTPSLDRNGSGGFGNLPQALFPTMQVALDQPGIPQLSAAVATLCGFQRLSPVLIQPTVVPLDTAKTSGQPLLVVGTSSALAGAFDPPLAADGHGVFVVNGKTYGTFSQPADVASIQAFAQSSQDRSVVMVTTTGSWAQLDHLIQHYGYTESTWGALTGDVTAIGAQGRVVDLAIRTGGPQVFTAAPKNYTLYIGAAVIFVLALVGLALWELFRIRRRRAARASQQSEAS